MGGELDVYRATADELETEIRRVFDRLAAERVSRRVVSALPGRLVLLGHPVAHSLSPRFQNAALRAAGIPLVLRGARRRSRTRSPRRSPSSRAEHAAGNVTIPHKEAVAALLRRR